MNNEILIKIKSLYPDLTKSEKIVAKYVHNHIEEIGYMSIGDLASKCEVGETTILRFCKRIGFNGYYDLKQKIILNIQKNNVIKKDNNTISRIKTMIEETSLLIEQSKITSVCNKLMESKIIYIFGSGFSGISALAAQMRFATLGYQAIAVREGYLKVLYANMMNNEDIAIGLSISGEDDSTIESIKLAKSCGAFTVAITNHEESTLASIADLVLLTAGKEMGKEGSTIVTEMSQLIVLETLFELLHELDKENIERMNRKIFDYINKEI